MNENKVIEAFTLKQGPKSFFEALWAVMQTEQNHALANAVDVGNTGETRAWYAGQVAAIIDLRSVIETYAEKALVELSLDAPQD